MHNACVNACEATDRVRRRRRWPGVVTLWAAVWLPLLLQSCGGGGSDGGGDAGSTPAASLTPSSGRVSADSPVAAGCTGGGAVGVLYANAEVEPMLARSPTNPQQLLAAWQQDRWSDGGARAIVSAVSQDGGATWTRTLHPLSRCGGAATGSAGDFERATDPWVDIGSDGVMHVMGLAFSGASFTPGSRNAMLASRSIDGGRTWSAAQTLVLDGATLFNDKNTLTVDAIDPRFVYAVWDRVEPSENAATLLARSTDAGLSWEPAREIYRPPATAGGSTQTIGNRIVVLTAGTQRGWLVNVFTQVDRTVATVNGMVVTSARNTMRVMRSADRGASWSTPVTVAEHRAVGARDPNTGTLIRDGGIIPSITTGPDGALWVAWQDSRFSGGVRDAIAVSRSSDGGATWSTPVQASRGGSAPAFTPTLHVRDDGLVGLLYFDLRPDTADTGTLLAASWLATSSDGATWADTVVWSPFDMAQAPNARGLFLGDYMGLVSSGNRFLPLLVLSGTDLNNRNDAYLLPVTPGTASATAASTVETPVQALSEAEFQARRNAFTQRVMEQRLPDWARRVRLQAPASEGR